MRRSEEPLRRIRLRGLWHWNASLIITQSPRRRTDADSIRASPAMASRSAFPFPEQQRPLDPNTGSLRGRATFPTSRRRARAPRPKARIGRRCRKADTPDRHESFARRQTLSPVPAGRITASPAFSSSVRPLFPPKRTFTRPGQRPGPRGYGSDSAGSRRSHHASNRPIRYFRKGLPIRQRGRASRAA